MDKHEIDLVIRGFLERVVENGFRLSDKVSVREQQAIQHYISNDGGISTPPAPPSIAVKQAPKAVNIPEIDFSSLEPTHATTDMVGLDFGTAFSKATFFSDKTGHPTPLELQKSATGKNGLLLESTVYISADEHKVFFGPQAIDASSSEDIVGRLRFDSPKQVLSIEGAEGLSSKVDVAIDPTASFTKRELLTLYLGYLCAVVSAQLTASGRSKYTARRYALPVWSDIQIVEISRLLKQMLIDAQILADTIPFELWRSGLDVDYAKKVLQALKEKCPANDDRREKAQVLGGHVLEATAAAAAIGEKLENRRPVALVVDIGAGTTDIGLFYFVFPSERSGKFPKISAFADGSIARKIAGNRLDDILRDYIKARASLAESDHVYFRLKRDIREIKRRLALTGSLRIEGLDDLEITLKDFISSEPVQKYRRELRKAVEDVVSRLGASAIRNPDGNFGILTGGGATFPIFSDFFDEPFETSSGKVSFKRIDARPGWFDQLDPAFGPFFGQLAVALGASAPNLPDRAATIRSVPATAPTVTGISPSYR